MKFSFLFVILMCFGCASQINYDAEKASITELLNNETNYVAKGDSANWASCWVTSEEASMMITSADETQNFYDFNSLAHEIGQIEPFELTLSRNNFNFVIGQEVAFVSFDQQDNWGSNGERMTKETRTLKKVEGQWHIGQLPQIFEKLITDYQNDNI